MSGLGWCVPRAWVEWVMGVVERNAPYNQQKETLQLVQHDLVGCDNKGHIKVIRQIRLGETVFCVLGENSYRKDGSLRHKYEFQGNADQALVFRFKPTGGKQRHLYLVLLGPDQQVVASGNNPSKQTYAQVHVKLPVTGMYTVLVSNGNATESSDYKFILNSDFGV